MLSRNGSLRDGALGTGRTPRTASPARKRNLPPRPRQINLKLQRSPRLSSKLELTQVLQHQFRKMKPALAVMLIRHSRLLAPLG